MHTQNNHNMSDTISTFSQSYDNLILETPPSQRANFNNIVHPPQHKDEDQLEDLENVDLDNILEPSPLAHHQELEEEVEEEDNDDEEMSSSPLASPIGEADENCLHVGSFKTENTQQWQRPPPTVIYHMALF